MVLRVVLIKLKDPQRRTHWCEVAGTVLRRLPGVLSVDVGAPSDAEAEVWDMLFSVRFAGAADISIYNDHPDHQAFLADLRPHVEIRKVWNFELT